MSGETQGTWYYRVTASDGTFTTTSPVSDAVVVDTTPPTVQLTCPGLVDQGTSASASYSASDSGGAGLVEPATGTVPVDTSTPGQHTASFTVHDTAGNSASGSCDYTVNGPPAAPGTPTVAPTPTNGQFTVTWTAATDPNNDTLTYTLLRQNAAGGGYTTVASGLTSASSTFTEGEGTWTYEVFANDGRLNGPTSAASAAAVADRTAPNAPTLLPTRVAESGTWFKDTVTVQTIENGDPTLADGSAGSGIDATKTTPGQTLTANGANSVTGSVTDKAGNSKSTTSSFNVDAKAPTLSVTCPAPAPTGSVESATWTASDGESGLATAGSGSTALATDHAGTFTSPVVTATDKVGHSTTGTCSYTITKATPLVSWATPAPIIYGTPLGATQLNAVTAVPGTFAYTPPAGTILQPGTQALSVTFTPTSSADYTTATASVQIAVNFTKPCITNAVSGALTITSGTAVCITTGGTIGSIVVQAGGALWINHGIVIGAISANKAAALTLCSAGTGPLTVTGSTGYLLLGGIASTGCSGNTFVGPVSITNNTGGLSFSNNKVFGSATITNNTGGFTYTGNTITGSVTVTGNS